MITTNTGAKKIEGTDNWREIFDAHNDSVDAHDKVSEAMTYVVNGNKSIENAAIPVGSYVRLANSTIVGRSDGIYTVKTAIPVNTVIDSSYFNENAPIPGGVANALNSKITANPYIISGIGTYNYNDAMFSGMYEDGYYYLYIPIYGFTPRNVTVTLSTSLACLLMMVNGSRDMNISYVSYDITESRIKLKLAPSSSISFPPSYTPVLCRFFGTITIS